MAADTGRDLVVVMHQIGSHGPSYFKRYTQDYRRFAPTCDTNQLQSCSQAELVNSYDDSILYTDHILAETIDVLAGASDRFDTAMLYVSDHGESLGEKGIYLHGMPYMFAPDAQTHVPMVLWTSPGYRAATALDMACVRGEAGKVQPRQSLPFGARHVRRPHRCLSHRSRPARPVVRARRLLTWRASPPRMRRPARERCVLCRPASQRSALPGTRIGRRAAIAVFTLLAAGPCARPSPRSLLLRPGRKRLARPPDGRDALFWLFYRGPKVALAVASAASLLWLLRCGLTRRWRSFETRLLLALSVLGVTALLAGLAKGGPGISCPVQETIFAGPYAHVAIPDRLFGIIPFNEHFRCWPAGHAAAGFGLLGLRLLAPGGVSPSWRHLAPGLAGGWALGIYQMAQGQHYLSHTVVTMALAFLLSSLAVMILDRLEDRG